MSPTKPPKTFHLHLVSDATGETLNSMARAACAQFANVEPVEHVYALVRSNRQLERTLTQIEKYPGLVFFTLMSTDLRDQLEDFCRAQSIPHLSVLDSVLATLENFLGTELTHKPGGQHEMTAEYFRRMEALAFTMAHDDGQLSDDLAKADVVLVGVSRTSKTPTCIYLANRGIKAANVPLVPNIPLPDILERLQGPLVVGLSTNPDRLVQIRRNRLLSLNQDPDTDYVDYEAVRSETMAARKLFARLEWPVIDVSRRSVEETAAAIYNLYTEHKASFTGNNGK
ncbi:MAG: kinase/pyrophosphorylase [Alphaproteobacteria bacterium]|nr:MAG: kinase/pyrophosphorylase [Alphaproteobacteria bacterium]